MPETIIVAGPGDISDAHAQRYAAKCADVIVADTALGERERERERKSTPAAKGGSAKLPMSQPPIR